jgi:adenylate cyclase
MLTPKATRLWLLQIILFGIGGALSGLLYIALEQGTSKIYPFINGVLAGLVIGLVIGCYEIYLFHPRLHQSSFLRLLFLRVTIYMVTITLVILVIVTINRAYRHDQSFFEALISEESQIYLRDGKFERAIAFTFFISLTANFTRLISFKIGRGMLLNFILGVYHKPQLVKRAFLFLQIKNASPILEQFNIELYHNFLNRIYQEISLAVMRNHGYIYEYVDNQIIAYWKSNKQPAWEQHLVNCYTEIKFMMDTEPYFKETFNLTPVIVGAAHGGEVIQAEIGELKTEIVFQGDVLNTTSRILALAVNSNSDLIVSDYLIDNLQQAKYNLVPLEKTLLQGKHHEINLYALQKHVGN